MATTKYGQNPKKNAAQSQPKAKSQQKAARKPARKSPSEAEALKKAKRSNTSSYCITFVQWSKDDTVKMLSHYRYEYFFIMSPHLDEVDSDLTVDFDDNFPLTEAKGATRSNQIRIWAMSRHAGEIHFDVLSPSPGSGKTVRHSDGNEYEEYEHFSHYNLYISTFSQSYDGDGYVAFRQFVPDVDEGIPKLRGIPIQKLLVNIEVNETELRK